MTELTVEQRLDRIEGYALGKCWRCGEIIRLNNSHTIERPHKNGEVLLCSRCYQDYCSLHYDCLNETENKKENWLAEERNKHIKWL